MSPPTLIGRETMDPLILALREKNNAAAYASKTWSRPDWNTYVAFGIQEYHSITEYFTERKKASPEGKHLRLARYYRLHLENHATVPRSLMGIILEVKQALAMTHPGFFDMTLVDMDLYLVDWKTSQMDVVSNPDDDESEEDDDNIPEEAPPTRDADLKVAAKHSPPVARSDAASNAAKTAASVADSASGSPATLVPASMETPADDSVAPSIATMDVPTLDTTSPSPSSTPLPSSPAGTPVRMKPKKRRKKKTSITGVRPDGPLEGYLSPPSYSRPKSVKQSMRVEVRWAPKDFHELRQSTEKMHACLAPIMSCFNNEHTWIMEWQTDQMSEVPELSLSGFSKYLSLRSLTLVRERCFYFSFRLHGSGVQYMHTCQSKVVQTAKEGEHISFDPSFIPICHGELMVIGDILLKDASTTHRGRYLQHLKDTAVPPDSPIFDLKMRHRDPIGNRVPILSVRCGKSVSTQVAEIPSRTLCGEGLYPEIFISRVGIGANQTTVDEHAQIYSKHIEFLNDITYLPFPFYGPIDAPVTEYLESGETIMRSPRMWAKSLQSSDGTSLEVDLEHEKMDGHPLLIVPSLALCQAREEMAAYWKRQNPTLSHAAKMYTASQETHPDIPKTVFTRNIATLLAKKISKPTMPAGSTTGDDTSTSVTPLSSLTAATSKTSSRGSIAWQRPLQATFQYNKVSSSANTQTSKEINQAKQIAILEAQLNLNGDSSGDEKVSTCSKSTRSRRSKLSQASSCSIDRSGLTNASAHSRLDTLEASVQDMLAMVTKLVVNSEASPRETRTAAGTPSSPPPPTRVHRTTTLTPFKNPPSTEDTSMTDIVPFNGGGPDTSLVEVPASPGKPHRAKRRKGLSSPPMSNPSQEQYTDPAMSQKRTSNPSYSGGQAPC